jgi:hypothetical protein
MLLKQRGQFAESANLYRRAVTILERTVAPDHPNLVACRANYRSLREQSH